MTLPAVGLIVVSVVEGGPVVLMQLNVVSSFMADHTTLTLGKMALIAVPVIPATSMRPRGDLRMAGSAGILLVTHHAAGPVPGRLDAMRTQPPQVVVRDGLHHAVALPAGVL